MSYNKSPLAFEDIREAFERALNAPRGIKITCTTRGAAIGLRSRFNYYRAMDRETNRTTYPSDHPMWNRSIYDRLVLRLPPKGSAHDNVLFIEQRNVSQLQVEELP